MGGLYIMSAHMQSAKRGEILIRSAPPLKHLGEPCKIYLQMLSQVTGNAFGNGLPFAVEDSVGIII